MNPAQPVRGRASKCSQKEANLRALVESYAASAVETRNRLKYLANIQYHLSETAFSKLLEPVTDPSNNVLVAQPNVSAAVRSGSQPDTTSRNASFGNGPVQRFSSSQPVRSPSPASSTHGFLNVSHVSAAHAAPSASSSAQRRLNVSPSSATDHAPGPSTSFAHLPMPGPSYGLNPSRVTRSGRVSRSPSPFGFQ